jgi:hypothetical protein
MPAAVKPAAVRQATMPRRGLRLVAAACGLVLLVGVTASCAGFRVERDGRKTGDAICDVKDASNADDAKSALADVKKWTDKALQTTGRPVSADVRDINENLSDLVRHTVNGNSALRRQDIAVIRRNVQSVIRVTSGRSQRFYEGLDEGLSNCSD